MGFVMARSKASLIAGSICGLVTLMLSAVVYHGASETLVVGAEIALGIWAFVMAFMFKGKYKAKMQTVAPETQEALVGEGSKKPGGGIFLVLAVFNVLVLVLALVSAFAPDALGPATSS